MPTKVAKNTFNEGMDKDTDPKQVKANTMSDGYNVSLSQDGREKQISTFLGTTALQTLAATVTTRDDIHIMGMYEARATIDGTETNVGLVFLYNANGTDSFKVFAIPEDGSDLFEMYTENVTLTDADRFVDCVIHKEGGTSYAYFTDAELAPKKLPLVITTSGKGDGVGGTYYFREEILMIRAGFDGNISAVAVTENGGGDLLCGTYQFSVRLFNSSLNKYTKWSLLTQPVVVRMPYSTTETSFGGVGFVSTSDIDLTITTITNYTTNSLYDYFQIAVVENINGGSDSILTAKVLQPEAYAGTTETYNYATNKIAKELIHIDELTVDDAAIKNLKSLAIKNNRLLSLNANYHPLDYDAGTPTIGSGTVPIQQTFTGHESVPYRDADNATNFVGYFRDELYRYGVVYEDEFGNYSKPSIIDFDVATANAAAAGTIDWRFPSRDNSKYGTLLGASGDTQALGLGIKQLVNHPSWAVAVHVVRVPRKKKILYQTPLVPSIVVQPAKATGDYPAQRNDESGQLDVLNVEATNPDGSFVPKNFYHILPKNMIRFGDLYTTTAETGTVYATHADATSPMSYLFYTVVSEDNGASYTVQPLDNEQTLYSVSSASEHIEIFKQIDGDDDPDGEPFAGETGTFRLKRRAKGTTAAWTTVATEIIPTGTVDFGAYTMDLTTYDYLIELEDA